MGKYDHVDREQIRAATQRYYMEHRHIEPTYSQIARKLSNDYDKILFDAFANYGYTKEWLLKPANRNRVKLIHLSEARACECYVDGRHLFTVKHEISQSSTNLMAIVQTIVVYHFGNLPEQWVMTSGYLDRDRWEHHFRNPIYDDILED